MIEEIFKEKININKNFINIYTESEHLNQKQTNESFSEKWVAYDKTEEKEIWYKFQKQWYLKLYGFDTEKEFSEFLKTKQYIFDAGCGLGYKAHWFAKLSPKSIVIGMDYSDAVDVAANNYKDIDNLYFIKGDIADLPFKDNSINYTSCDQVIMHTENPEKTFRELTRITNRFDEFSCYVYAKKALPRELIDDYFRIKTKNLSHKQLWEMSEQLTQLGKVLSELNLDVDIPDIPLLGIKGGKQDLQRFIYWNFIKCFWNEEFGEQTSVFTNFDWYSPSNAKRYSKEEYISMINDNSLDILYFHEEEACYSGRFKKLK